MVFATNFKNGINYSIVDVNLLTRQVSLYTFFLRNMPFKYFNDVDQSTSRLSLV